MFMAYGNLREKIRGSERPEGITVWGPPWRDEFNSFSDQTSNAEGDGFKFPLQKQRSLKEAR